MLKDTVQLPKLIMAHGQSVFQKKKVNVSVSIKHLETTCKGNTYGPCWLRLCL